MNSIILHIFFIFMGLQLFSQTFEIYNNDTINRMDANKKKQGYWLKLDKKKIVKTEEGFYKNDKKEGVWKEYYPDGIIHSELTYRKGLANGVAKIYYENGILAEEGNWINGKWVGEYKYYFKNGNPFYIWNYSEKGVRQGIQKYFYENGSIKIEGEWNNGDEQGFIKSYYQDGTLKSENFFSTGQIDLENSKEYKSGKKKILPEITKVDSGNIVENEKYYKQIKDSSEVGLFREDGFHKLYNKQLELETEGFFIGGRLFEGKYFIYDSAGILFKTVFYKEGKPAEIIMNRKSEKNE